MRPAALSAAALADLVTTTPDAACGSASTTRASGRPSAAARPFRARAGRRATRRRGQSRASHSGRPRRRLAGARIGTSLVTNLAARAHRAWFVVAGPKLDDEAVKQLRITELVSEFTTYYPCCAPRVTNIERAAELLDGTIVRPGKSSRSTTLLGKRTEAKGFVSAPQIFNGRLEDAVGGGISQVATTMFNAAFFSGVSSSPTRRISSTSRGTRWAARRPSRGAGPS